jgi:hypothetical protein
MEPSAEDEERQTSQWYGLYDLIADEIEKFGVEGLDGDFWVDTDNFGTFQHKVYVKDLKLLKLAVVKNLQRVLKAYPGWEIVHTIALPGPGRSWPDMCLIIRAHEVIDMLDWRFFPSDYQGIRYEGGRPATRAELEYYFEPGSGPRGA